MNPTHFYFCVPPDMKESALKEIEEVNPKYGLIIVAAPSGWYVRIVKSAKRLYNRPPGPDEDERIRMILWDIAMRCGAKLCGIYEKQTREAT